jgi:hypothetical protein
MFDFYFFIFFLSRVAAKNDWCPSCFVGKQLGQLDGGRLNLKMSEPIMKFIIMGIRSLTNTFSINIPPLLPNKENLSLLFTNKKFL